MPASHRRGYCAPERITVEGSAAVVGLSLVSQLATPAIRKNVKRIRVAMANL
jgi:hypothetical protein